MRGLIGASSVLLGLTLVVFCAPAITMAQNESEAAMELKTLWGTLNDSGGLADHPTSAGVAAIYSCDTPTMQVGLGYLQERPSEEGVKTVDVFLRLSAVLADWDIGNGISEGKHAVHIHETGSCTPCGSAGGHFDPGPNSNTSPDGNHPFHAGDLTNISVDSLGRGTYLTSTTRITLSPGPLSIFDEDGSAFIVHTNPDSYCAEGEAAGCAGGSRAACGIIRPVP